MNNVQFSVLGEIFPFHLRAKGISLGVAGICLLNIIWLQAAPTALENIGWKYYLCFIIPSSIAAVLILAFWPDTNGLPLEEIARIFGDEDELFGSHRGVEEGLRGSNEVQATGTDSRNEKAAARSD